MCGCHGQRPTIPSFCSIGSADYTRVKCKDTPDRRKSSYCKVGDAMAAKCVTTQLDNPENWGLLSGPSRRPGREFYTRCRRHSDREDEMPSQKTLGSSSSGGTSQNEKSQERGYKRERASTLVVSTVGHSSSYRSLLTTNFTSPCLGCLCNKESQQQATKPNTLDSVDILPPLLLFESTVCVSVDHPTREITPNKPSQHSTNVISLSSS